MWPTSKSTAAEEFQEGAKKMLKLSEREKLQDCLMLVQSARTILRGFGSQWEWVDEIHDCFNSADEKLSSLLRR
jgi:hypothetical protein